MWVRRCAQSLVHAAKRGGPALPQGGNVGERLKGGAEGGEDGGVGNWKFGHGLPCRPLDNGLKFLDRVCWLVLVKHSMTIWADRAQVF